MKPIIIPQSHDALFKLCLKNDEMAKQFMEIYLPNEVKTICDLNSLKQEHGSFVEPNLTQKFNDVLYSVNTTSSSSHTKKGYIYCLIECQHSPDKLIAFRLMHYAMMVMDNHLKQGNKNLPLVVPLLFYCGKKPHPKTVSLNWLELFDKPDMAKIQYTEPFKLIDIQKTDDAEIKQHNKIGLMEYLLKHIHSRDILHMLNDLRYFLMLNQVPKEELKSFLIYLFNHGKIENPQQFFDLQLSNNGDDTMTTLADYLREQGMQIGEQRGRQEGLQNATFTIARNLLKNRANIELVKNSTGLSEEEIKKLQQ